MTTRTTDPRPAPGHAADEASWPGMCLDERMQALEDAADAAMLAPSVHGSQPWTVVLHRDRLELRADRARQLRTVDPDGRELVQSLGAALFNTRVALAARGWAVTVDRFPDAGATDLVATVRPVPGAPEAHLPLLADALHQRHTHRTGFLPEEVPEELLQHLTAAVAAEDCDLVAVVSPAHRRLLARLTLEADAVQNGDPAHRADIRRWRPARPGPAPAGTTGDRRTVDSDSGEDRTFVLLTSAADTPLAWLRSGEALERLLLELTRLGWAASPLTQALEVPLTRAHVRAALTWGAFPQMLLRIGFAESPRAAARRHRDEVVRNSGRQEGARAAATSVRLTRAGVRDQVALRPRSDGRGGTTWL
ncbi:Acg family FMN-binding oxidoreductase [Modestobacter sp. SSW1-42]|uniref:Acg family FMN-binding oxidoreductase n=1 Tax=Modestobacter sp. SSW1-42 TaxID=596372 RepID=UPI0039863406